MLMRFSVKNFLSFDDLSEFTMFPGKQRLKKEHLIESDNVNLLKFTAIYGANASGKSNLIKAISESRKIIVNGVDSISSNKYHRGRNENRDKLTTFEYEVMIDNKCYAYGVNILIDKKEIYGEWLYEITSNSESVIFERNLEDDSFKSGIKFKDKSDKMRFNIYSEDIKSNKKTLFLNELNRNKEKIYKENSEFNLFRKVYEWFVKTLDINFASAPITDFKYMMSDDENYNDTIAKILDMFGTGIIKFNLVQSDVEDLRRDIPKAMLENLTNVLKDSNGPGAIHIRGKNQFYEIIIGENDEVVIKTLSFRHENQESDFYLYEESDGTRRLMDLIEILLTNENKVYIIDEIDRSLHPNLTYKFIEIFFEFAKNRNIQLIVTTHEDRVLDLDILRRDEVWFIEKDNKGVSDLYSLEEYGDRFDKKILRAYLDGRYGAVPNFKDITIEEILKHD